MTTVTGPRLPAVFAIAPWRRLPRDPVLLLAGSVCVLLVLVAVFAPLIAPYPPDQTNILYQNLSPSANHLLGTDALGRDILSRLIYGSRLSLLGPGLVVLVCVVVGTSLAIASVWIGGLVDRAVARALDVVFAFPALLLAILAVAILGQGLTAPVIALSVAYIPYVARVVRSVALRERHLPYIESCRSMGFSGWRICTFHLLPNVRLMVAAQATIAFASALMDLSAISFLGLGVQPPASDWGTMVSDGTSALVNGHAMESLAAGSAIAIAVIAFNVLGERLNRASEAA